MSRRRSAFLISFWLVVVFSYVLTLRHEMQIDAQRRQMYGRYTERDVAEMATPIIQAIIPNRNDLYLAADRNQTVDGNGQRRRIWYVDCRDSQGNDLVHISRDADT